MNRTVCIAPMMACTDRHDRYLLRLISPHVLLYTEMVTSAALKHGDAERLLAYDSFEHPLALQLGGCDPAELAHAARLGEQAGYAEINLNVGCPSPRVKAGRFGACLMQEASLVADCVAAMREAVSLPVTIKCRTGIDDRDSYEFLVEFVETVSRAGCDVFVVHARKAWLQGLSPRENREVPPLCYETVYRLKKDFPDVTVVINGGIRTVPEIQRHLQAVDGVMLGREPYGNPWRLHEIEQTVFANPQGVTRKETVLKYLPYVERQLQAGVRLSSITRHLLGMFYGEPGGKKWRRFLSEQAHRKGAGTEVIEQALMQLDES